MVVCSSEACGVGCPLQPYDSREEAHERPLDDMVLFMCSVLMEFTGGNTESTNPDFEISEER